MRKDIIYFQTDADSTSSQKYTPTLKKDDYLSIVVSSADMESAKPFNSPFMSESGTGSGQSDGDKSGYLVDENGDVNLPVLGKIHLAGLNRTEAIAFLQDKLKQYIQNPVVNIQISNYKITILGGVSNPGVFKINNERLTIIEAIGMAGDLKITGKRKNILIIREIDGKKVQYRMDLTKSDEVFNSPAYYLVQNDVVYVEPNFKERSTGASWRDAISVFTSLTAITISTVTLISRK
jgi:polysaccharide export outer membrane protein